MSQFITPSYDFCPNCGASTVLQTLDDQPVKTCVKACGFAFFNNPTPVVAVIVETDGGVVLAQNVAWPEGMFSVITGYVDPHELPQQTALRETQEELGLVASDPRFVGHYMFHQKNQLIIAYAVKAQGEVVLNAELAAYKLIPKHTLKAWPGPTGQAVADWLASEEMV